VFNGPAFGLQFFCCSQMSQCIVTKSCKQFATVLGAAAQRTHSGGLHS
jgi:hypothetical protein